MNSASSGSWAVGACLLMVPGGSACGMCSGQGPAHPKPLNWDPRSLAALAGSRGAAARTSKCARNDTARATHTPFVMALVYPEDTILNILTNARLLEGASRSTRVWVLAKATSWLPSYGEFALALHWVLQSRPAAFASANSKPKKH